MKSLGSDKKLLQQQITATNATDATNQRHPAMLWWVGTVQSHRIGYSYTNKKSQEVCKSIVFMFYDIPSSYIILQSLRNLLEKEHR